MFIRPCPALFFFFFLGSGVAPLRADTAVETKPAFKLVRATGQCSKVHGKFRIVTVGAGIAQLVVHGLAVHGVAGSILLWGHFPVEGIFSLGVNMGSNSIPPKTPSDERSSLCTHVFHRTDSWRSCPRRVNASNKNTPSTHHPRRRNVTTLMVGLKNGHIRKNLTSWGTPKKKKKKKNCNSFAGHHILDRHGCV